MPVQKLPNLDESSRYDPTELLADRVVHVVGIIGGLAGMAWLLCRLPPDASTKLTLSLWIYGFGLLAMLTASALYNFASPGPVKAQLRRLDHAMIFVMIAGSYTPFALDAFPVFSGRLLLGIIWILALAGVFLKLVAKPRTNRLSVSLYIGMGWVIIGFFPILVASITERSLLLLISGGVVYSVGGGIHAWGGVRFHNVIWHIMVLLGAALQFGSIAQVVSLPAP